MTMTMDRLGVIGHLLEHYSTAEHPATYDVGGEAGKILVSFSWWPHGEKVSRHAEGVTLEEAALKLQELVVMPPADTAPAQEPEVTAGFQRVADEAERLAAVPLDEPSPDEKPLAKKPKRTKADNE